MINTMGHELDIRWNAYVGNRKWASDYWRKSAVRRDSWKRALRGKTRYGRLFNIMRQQVTGWFHESKGVKEVTNHALTQMRETLIRGFRKLVMRSADDSSISYFEKIVNADLDSLLASGSFEYRINQESDDNFTVLDNQRELLSVIDAWDRPQ